MKRRAAGTVQCLAQVRTVPSQYEGECNVHPQLIQVPLLLNTQDRYSEVVSSHCGCWCRRRKWIEDEATGLLGIPREPAPYASASNDQLSKFWHQRHW
jgi:hypothetical protein